MLHLTQRVKSHTFGVKTAWAVALLCPCWICIPMALLVSLGGVLLTGCAALTPRIPTDPVTLRPVFIMAWRSLIHRMVEPLLRLFYMGWGWVRAREREGGEHP